MHVVLLTMTFPPQTGGVQTYLFETFRRVAAWHDIDVVTPVGGTHDDINMRHVRPDPHNFIGYWRALRQLQPDCVVVGHAHPQLLLPATLYRRAGLMAIAYGNDYLAAQLRWHRPLFNRMLAKACPLITITQHNARRLRSIGVQNVVVVYPGVNPQRFRPGKRHQERNPTLLTVGRLVPRKGIDTVIRSLPELLRKHPDVVYWIAGDGPDRERLESLVSERRLSHAVRFLGRVPDQDLPDLYRGADIFVMPVREEANGASIEGFGIVYLEAAASGLPVIAGNSGGASEAVKDGETGLVITASSEAVAVALNNLLSNPPRRRQLGEAGRRWVERDMHWDRAAHHMLEVLARHDG